MRVKFYVFSSNIHHKVLNNFDDMFILSQKSVKECVEGNLSCFILFCNYMGFLVPLAKDLHFAPMELNAIISNLQLLHIVHVLSSWKTCPKVDQHPCWSLAQSKSMNPKIANPFPLLKIILCSIIPFNY